MSVLSRSKYILLALAVGGAAVVTSYATSGVPSTKVVSAPPTTRATTPTTVRLSDDNLELISLKTRAHKAEAAKERHQQQVTLLNQTKVLQTEAAQQMQQKMAQLISSQIGTSHHGGNGCGSDLNCIRNRESRGDYSICNSSGHCGAYQFAQSTWNNTTSYACSHGVPSLCKDIGKNPATVAPADQDTAAQELMNDVPGGGPSQWATS